MYDIEFYEDRNGKCDMSDFLHMLHAAHRDEFCKAAAFLDYLAENGSRGDKAVCKCPEGTIYMHCIPGIDKHSGRKSPGTGRSRAGPIPLRRGSGFGGVRFSDHPAFCVILYGRHYEKTDSGASYVILHYFFTYRDPAGIPFRHLQKAVCKQKRYRKYRRPG